MLQYAVYIPTIIGMTVIAFFVLLKNKKSVINWTFFIFSILAALWLLCLFVADTANQTNTALTAARSAIVLSSIFPIVFLYFSLIFPIYKKVNTWKFLILAIPGILFAVNSFSDQIDDGKEIEVKI